MPITRTHTKHQQNAAQHTQLRIREKNTLTGRLSPSHTHTHIKQHIRAPPIPNMSSKWKSFCWLTIHYTLHISDRERDRRSTRKRDYPPSWPLVWSRREGMCTGRWITCLSRRKETDESLKTGSPQATVRSSQGKSEFVFEDIKLELKQ